jgi:hypothetical protein
MLELKLPLIDMASSRFSPLTSAEMRMLASIATGPVDLRSSSDSPSSGSSNSVQLNASTKPNGDVPANGIRAVVLEWLVTDKLATAEISHRQIRLTGATIVGELDLMYATIPYPMILRDCDLPNGITLVRATMPELDLRGSRVAFVSAAGATVSGDVFVSEGFEASDGIHFVGAHIGASLHANGGSFTSAKGYAIDMDRAVVAGNLFLNHGCRAFGGVNLLYVKIGVMLDCSSAVFKEENSSQALALMGASVGGQVLLSDNFESHGEIVLTAASIGMDLVCSGGRFFSPRSDACIVLDSAEIHRSAHFEDVACEGLVRLVGARVRSEVIFRNVQSIGAAPNGLDADSATIEGTLVWQRVAVTPQTVLRLDGCSVGFLKDEVESWPESGNLVLNGFKYKGLEGDVSTSQRIRWLGLQDSYRSQPYRQLAAILNERGDETDARDVLIAGEEARYAHGRLGLVGAAWNRLIKYTIGFGYLPRRALYWMVALTLAGSLVFGVANRLALMLPADPAVLRDATYRKTGALPYGYLRFRAFIYAVDVALPIIDFGQEKTWRPNSAATCQILGRTRPCGDLVQFYLWLHIALGWVFTTLGVAGLSGLIRRR